MPGSPGWFCRSFQEFCQGNAFAAHRKSFISEICPDHAAGEKGEMEHALAANGRADGETPGGRWTMPQKVLQRTMTAARRREEAEAAGAARMRRRLAAPGIGRRIRAMHFGGAAFAGAYCKKGFINKTK